MVVHFPQPWELDVSCTISKQILDLWDLHDAMVIDHIDLDLFSAGLAM